MTENTPEMAPSTSPATQPGEPQHTTERANNGGTPSLEIGSIKQFIAILSDARGLILTTIAMCLFATSFYLLLAPPRYIASATVLIDPPRVAPGQQAQPVEQFDVGTQSELIQSEVIALRVVEKLGFAKSKKLSSDNARFPRYLVQHLKREIISAFPAYFPPRPPADPVEAAVTTLRTNLGVRRVGIQTQVLEVSYQSTSPTRAANVANAFVSAYMADKRENLANAQLRSTTLMQKHLADAKSAAQRAELAVDAFKAKTQISNIASYRIRLKELQASALSYRAMHDNLLQRSIDASQRNIEPVGARLLNKASIPKFKSEPRTTLALTFGALLGLTFGIGLAVLRDYFAEGFRSTQDLRAFLNVPVFGEIPTVQASYQETPADEPHRICATLGGAARLVFDSPTSPAADVLRITQAALEKQRKPNTTSIVGITSAIQSEGRSTICINLARMLCASGHRVLLVDADWRHRGLSKSLATDTAAGISHILSGETTLADSVWSEPDSSVAFLPAGATDQLADHPNAALAMASRYASTEMHLTLLELSQDFDYMLVCLPPMEAAVDAAAAADWVDGFLLVVQSEKTPREIIAKSLEKSAGLNGKIVGAILNQVGTKQSGLGFASTSGSNRPSLHLMSTLRSWQTAAYSKLKLYYGKRAI